MHFQTTVKRKRMSCGEFEVEVASLEKMLEIWNWFGKLSLFISDFFLALNGYWPKNGVCACAIMNLDF